MVRSICIAVFAAGFCGIAGPLLAQDLAPTLAPHEAHVARPGRPAHKVKTAKAAKPLKEANKPLEPWAAVDPGRATGVAAPVEPGGAAVPGVHHIVQPDQDRLSYGVQWSSSNAPNGGQFSTQGVINEVNHDLGAPNAIGTDAEVGVKMHF